MPQKVRLDVSSHCQGPASNGWIAISILDIEEMCEMFEGYVSKVVIKLNQRDRKNVSISNTCTTLCSGWISVFFYSLFGLRRLSALIFWNLESLFMYVAELWITQLIFRRWRAINTKIAILLLPLSSSDWYSCINSGSVLHLLAEYFNVLYKPRDWI